MQQSNVSAYSENTKTKNKNEKKNKTKKKNEKKKTGLRWIL